MLLVVVPAGCSRPAAAPPKPPPPATVSRPVEEGRLNTVVLTAEAEQRLGLQTAAVERRATRRARSYGGEITLPANAVLTVSAPVSGLLQAPAGRPLPQVGAAVAEGQPMFALVPQALTQAERVALAQAKLQLEQARIDAEGQVKQAKVQVEAARVAASRAERLFRDMAGTRKDVDDAQAHLHLAQKALDAATLRTAAVAGAAELGTAAGTSRPLVIPVPRAGIVRATYAVAGEAVPAGAPLFEVMNTQTVWVKVPVYVGELPAIDEQAPARVQSLVHEPGTAGVEAKPIPAPPTAQPHASAVDLYYALPNPAGKYRPGVRVAAALPLRGTETSLGVPWSAVVHDVHGGAWVYEQTAPHTFTRRRVQVRDVEDQWAVLADGPAVGARVVTAGAAEVFGAEFGYGK
jgi:multidrug resistance efflux pump